MEIKELLRGKVPLYTDSMLHTYSPTEYVKTSSGHYRAYIGSFAEEKVSLVYGVVNTKGIHKVDISWISGFPLSEEDKFLLGGRVSDMIENYLRSDFDITIYTNYTYDY